MTQLPTTVVECPSCSAAFRLPTEKLKNPNAKMKCGKCNYIFVIETKAQPAEPSTMELMSLADVAQSAAQSMVFPNTPPPMHFKDSESGLRKKQNFETKDTPRSSLTVKSNSKITIQKPVEKEPLAKLARDQTSNIVRIGLIGFLLVSGFLFGSILTTQIIRWTTFDEIFKPTPNLVGLDLQAISFQGFYEIQPSKEALFHIKGQVFNQSSEQLKEFPLKVIFYSEDGEFLFQKDIPCCGKPIEPTHKANFQSSFTLSPEIDLVTAQYTVKSAQDIND